jgi:heavy metal translocating P-type ATPase
MKIIFNFLKKYKILGFVCISIIASFTLYVLNLHFIANWILGITTLIAVLPLLWDMISTLRNGQYGIDILAATAMITSIALGQYWTGIIISLMLTGGEALEDYAENKAKTELKSLLDNKPEIAHLIKNKKIIDVKVAEVKVSEILSILPGEVIPVDCQLITGETNVDESTLTGEAMPVEKSLGDTLLSGSVNIEGSITVKVIHTAKDSQYEQIIKLVKSAANSQSPFTRLTDRYSIPFTIISFMIAGGVWIVTGHAVRFLEVIVVATPCPLLLAAPIALISGMSRATKHGIIIKNGASLEKLAQAKTIAFDKTGTLTNGKPVLNEIKTFNQFNKNDVLVYAAALETNSNHIIAGAIINKAKSSGLKSFNAKQVKELPGHGLSGLVKGKHILIGKLKLMIDNHVEIPKNINTDKIENTVSYISIDNKLVGILLFNDEIRHESVNLINRLRKIGIKNFMIVTGDSISAAKVVGKKLGITQIFANCLPSDKMNAIENAEDKPIIFVGDGINDAPVLTLADVGIALGAKGSTAASESADVVIMTDDISKVASAIEIAKQTFFIAKQSILVGIGISILLMLVFATGRLKPIYGALLQELVDVVVIFNALRAHGIWQNYRNKKENLL